MLYKDSWHLVTNYFSNLGIRQKIKQLRQLKKVKDRSRMSVQDTTTVYWAHKCEELKGENAWCKQSWLMVGMFMLTPCHVTCFHMIFRFGLDGGKGGQEIFVWRLRVFFSSLVCLFQLSGWDYFLRKTLNFTLEVGAPSGGSQPQPPPPPTHTHCFLVQKWETTGPNVTLRCCFNTSIPLARNDTTLHWDTLGGTTKASLVTYDVTLTHNTWPEHCTMCGPVLRSFQKLPALGWPPYTGVSSKEDADRGGLSIKVTGKSLGDTAFPTRVQVALASCGQEWLLLPLMPSEPDPCWSSNSHCGKVPAISSSTHHSEIPAIPIHAGATAASTSQSEPCWSSSCYGEPSSLHPLDQGHLAGHRLEPFPEPFCLPTHLSMVPLLRICALFGSFRWFVEVCASCCSC